MARFSRGLVIAALVALAALSLSSCGTAARSANSGVQARR